MSMPPKYSPLSPGIYIAYAKQESFLLAAMDGDGFAWTGCAVEVKDDWAYFLDANGKTIKDCNMSYLQHNYRIEKK